MISQEFLLTIGPGGPVSGQQKVGGMCSSLFFPYKLGGGFKYLLFLSQKMGKRSNFPFKPCGVSTPQQ